MLYINIFVSLSVVVGLLLDYMLSSQLLFSSILSLFITGSAGCGARPCMIFLISASGSDWLYNYFSKVKQLITNFYERITYKGWRSPAIQLKKSLVPATVI